MNVQTALALSSLIRHSDTADVDAKWLLCKVLDRSPSSITSWSDFELTPAQVDRFAAMLVRRIKGEPVAYIRGDQGFWSLELEVDPTTLIPRPDTELLVEQALATKYSPEQPIKVLDLGTGTGAIALSVAVERPKWQVLGVDRVVDAVQLAKRNAVLNNISNAEFKTGHWFENIESTFELIVSNPPYISANDPHLQQGDVVFEPSSALVSAQDGLEDIMTIVSQAPRFLKRGGMLMLEHGYDQGERVRQIFLDHRFQSVETIKDYGGCDRVTLGTFTEAKS
ncbi:MAG: peptide chain release factor N(5)-glutamine methyltransferase [Gammaproteobacteria bacterium]|nr:peptide chain release factor N(5)-glutamine methyltransferase [Gammaproteobacteria bacterium]